MSFIKKETIRRIMHSFSKQGYGDNHYNYGNDRHSSLGTVASEAPFVLLAIGAILFFVIFGLYELLFNSPIAEWVAKSWSSIMNTSPQTVIDLPKQLPNQDTVMQRTIGEWLGFVPSFLGQVIALIAAPLTSILGVIIVFIAIAVRLGRHILGLFSFSSLSRNFAKALSWIILAFSFAPVLLEHF